MPEIVVDDAAALPSRRPDGRSEGDTQEKEGIDRGFTKLKCQDERSAPVVLLEAIRPQLMAGSLLLSIFTLFSGLVAMLVCYYTFRFNRLMSSTLLRFVGIGFGLLGFGLLVESGAALYLGLATVEFLNTVRRYEGLYILFNI